MGIGTTAKACMLTNRNFIGSELDEEIYIDSQRNLYVPSKKTTKSSV